MAKPSDELRVELFTINPGVKTVKLRVHAGGKAQIFLLGLGDKLIFRPTSDEDETAYSRFLARLVPGSSV